MILATELVDIALPGNAYLDALLFSQAYAPGTTINYVLKGNPGDTGIFGGALWAANGLRTGFNLALQSWSAVANITFVEAAGPYNGTGDTSAYDWIEEFGATGDGILGFHDLPLVGTLTGTFTNVSGFFVSANVALGGLAFATFVHEIGHGLGLLHPHNDGDEPPGDPTFPGVDDPFALGSNNLNQGVFTAMTYNSGYGDLGLPPSYEYGWEMGPMAFDIAAVQLLYGPNMTTNTGSTNYVLPSVNAAGTGWKAIWDAGGSDTISAGPSGLDSIIDLREATLLNAPGGGGYVSRNTGVLGGLTIAKGAVIENASGGSGDDWIHGNGANNVLNGGLGFDTVDFSGVTANLVINLATGTATGDGNDTLTSFENATGGSGNDVLTAIAGVSVAVGALDVFKRATDDLSARETALNLDTRFLASTTNPAIQTAPGGRNAITVHAQSGVGNDFYTFTASSGTIINIDIDNSFGIDFGSGLDTVVTLYDASGNQLATNDDGASLDVGSANSYDSFLTYSAFSSSQRYYLKVESFDFSVLPAGSSYDLHVSLASPFSSSDTFLAGSTLDGGGGDDTLNGNAGRDVLIGGTGADWMTGGGGDDRYFVDSQGDVLIESADGGDDSVTASTGFYLYAQVEDLYLDAEAGNAFGVGTDGINHIFGNTGDNLLIGGGAFDLLSGGGGNDALFGQDDRDMLQGGVGIDYLVGGAGDDDLDGGEGSDAIYGEDGNDNMVGGLSFSTDILVGGEGNDFLNADSNQSDPDYDLIDGGAGDDTYWVDTGADLTFEAVDSGFDTVHADVPVAGAGVYLWPNMENLVLEGTTSFGVGNELANQLTGNAIGNFLLGGAGDDILNGKGGGDVLFGEAGADTFVFETGTGGDVIGDFTAGSDKIQLTGIFATFAEAQANFIQNGIVGAINLGNGDLVVLHNVTMSSLATTDFIFG